MEAADHADAALQSPERGHMPLRLARTPTPTARLGIGQTPAHVRGARLSGDLVLLSSSELSCARQRGGGEPQCVGSKVAPGGTLLCVGVAVGTVDEEVENRLVTEPWRKAVCCSYICHDL